MKLIALDNQVLVSHIEKGERQIGMIIVPSDDGKSEGIRPVWAKVYAIGNGVVDIKVGQWILIEHGRWTREVTLKDGALDDNKISLWKVDYPNGLLAVADEKPKTDIFSKFAASYY